MTADEFRAALDAARISRRALAEWMGYASDTPVVRMAAGQKPVPPDLAEWLLRRAEDAPPRMI